MNIFNHSITSGARPAFSQGLRGMAQIDDVEGEDQGNAVRKACEGLKISVTAMRERELRLRRRSGMRRAECSAESQAWEILSGAGPPFSGADLNRGCPILSHFLR